MGTVAIPIRVIRRCAEATSTALIGTDRYKADDQDSFIRRNGRRVFPPLRGPHRTRTSRWRSSRSDRASRRASGATRRDSSTRVKQGSARNFSRDLISRRGPLATAGRTGRRYPHGPRRYPKAIDRPHTPRLTPKRSSGWSRRPRRLSDLECDWTGSPIRRTGGSGNRPPAGVLARTRVSENGRNPQRLPRLRPRGCQRVARPRAAGWENP